MGLGIAKALALKEPCLISKVKFSMIACQIFSVALQKIIISFLTSHGALEL